MSRTVDTTPEMLKPRTNLTSCIGCEVVVHFLEADQLKPLGLPTESDGTLNARLVGVERQGVWVEPSSWLEQALSDDGDVPHVFIKWENVLSLVRKHSSTSFATKREYRGLRPA